MSSFFPISPLVGITNTSYGAQVGVMDEKWAVRVVRGKKIIAEKPILDLSLDNIVGVAYGHIRVEGLSRHAVAMMAGRLMQFARQYQTAGVCPNYEIPELSYEDGTTVGEVAAEARGEVIVSSEDTAASSDLPDMRIGAVPLIPRTTGGAAWESVLESHAIMICEVAAYAFELPKGHMEMMFNKIADALIRKWAMADQNEPSTAIMKFGALIQACSSDSQLPKTGPGKATIEVRSCKVLEICRGLDPKGSRIPPGYPCVFHEMLASKLSELSGARIVVNTSSTGCIVGISLE